MINALQYVLIPVALLSVAVVLGLGIYSLAKGGSFSAKYSNKLMRYRVMLQAVAVALMVLFGLLLGQTGN